MTTRSDPATLPDLAAIRAAHARIMPFIRRTPVLNDEALDARVGATLHLKCENLQRIGAFKARGAFNAVLSLDEGTARAGVVTHSSGNHAAALSLAARERGIPAHIVMPSNAPAVKKRTVEWLGARITLCDPTLEARERACAEIMNRTGATLIHPYNDVRVIAGQGTAALELLEERPEIDVIMAPVGGGGLLSGTAIVAKGLSASALVIGAEPRAVDDAARSFESGVLMPPTNAPTLADGLRTSLGPITFAILRRDVDAILTTSEPAIAAAMRALWECVKIVVEPSGAVPIAALTEARERFAGRRIGVIVSGGNVDLDRLPWLTSA